MTVLLAMETSTNVESEVAVYETIGVESSSEDEVNEDTVNEAITTSSLTRDMALESFVERPHRTDESVSTRVARIRREIEELRRDGAEVEAFDLIAELKGQIKRRDASSTPLPSKPQYSSSSLQPDSRPEFAELESRVAKLESKFGLSLRSPHPPESLAKSVIELRRTIELLASNPENVSSLVNKMKEASTIKIPETKQTRIDTLYYRLRALDDAIDVLPQVVSRLQTLRYVHTEAVNQHEQLRDLERSLESMKGDISSWRAVLESLESRVSEYINMSKQNIKTLQH